MVFPASTSSSARVARHDVRDACPADEGRVSFCILKTTSGFARPVGDRAGFLSPPRYALRLGGVARVLLLGRLGEQDRG